MVDENSQKNTIRKCQEKDKITPFARCLGTFLVLELQFSLNPDYPAPFIGSNGLGISIVSAFLEVACSCSRGSLMTIPSFSHIMNPATSERGGKIVSACSCQGKL